MLAAVATSVDQTGVALYAAEVMRLNGLTVRALGRGDPQPHVRSAQERAQSQGALTLALRGLLDRLDRPSDAMVETDATQLLRNVESGGTTPDTVRVRAIPLRESAE